MIQNMFYKLLIVAGGEAGAGFLAETLRAAFVQMLGCRRKLCGVTERIRLQGQEVEMMLGTFVVPSRGDRIHGRGSTSLD